jgi:hypothetical protein
MINYMENSTNKKSINLTTNRQLKHVLSIWKLYFSLEEKVYQENPLVEHNGKYKHFYQKYFFPK